MQNSEGEDVKLTSNDQVRMDTPHPSVCRVAVKLPPFWPTQPDIWFHQVEARFNLAGVTQDQTKFNYIVSELDQRYAAEVVDIIRNPPEKNKYEFLKAQLINRIATSREQQIRQLLQQEEMGDRRPSQYLRHLRNLAGNDVSTKLLRTIWVSHLPQQIQTIIVTTDESSSLDTIAELADKVFAVVPHHCVNSVQPQPDLQAKIESLTKQVASLVAMNRDNYHKRNRSASASRRQVNTADSGLCWYHKKFGKKAVKCQHPCTWKDSENSSSSL